MNLFQRIIAWLATRFLIKAHIQDLFIDKVLVGENDVQVLRNLFARYNSTDAGRAPGGSKNLNVAALNLLYRTFGTCEMTKLLFFKTLKEERIRCADACCDEEALNELLTQLRDNNAANPMKRLANFKQILRTAMPQSTEGEIAVLAQIAMHTSHNLVANNQFLKEI